MCNFVLRNHLLTMEKTKQGLVAVRYNISEKAVEAVAVFQASERIKGNKLTKEAAADYMLSNFKIDKK